MEEALNLLKRMGLEGRKVDDLKFSVKIPITRSDILHSCDIAEDIAIAHGINNIPAVYPSTSTIGGQVTLNKIGDLVRQEIAQAGYNECLNWALCSTEDIGTSLNNKDIENAIQIGIFHFNSKIL